jgi:hypothetical protein
MATRFRQSLVALASAIACFTPCVPALAQSLALTYRLDPVNAPQALRMAPVVNRCAGLSWAASLAASCPAEASARGVAAPAAAEAVGATASPERALDVLPAPAASARRTDPESYSATEPQPRRFQLPYLGSPAADAHLRRIAGSNDEYPGNPRSTDVNVRVVSKYRVRGDDVSQGYSAQSYRFNDVTTENRTQASGMKNLGLELLVPFQ